jgi:tetratricopeptide (TPR) repeat protein
LELNRPKECLNLCNRFLDRIEYSAESDDLMININNNKAAALNLLGRSSEAILLLEHCLKLKEKDTMLKSIGDSYFSLGKLEKAIQSY